MRTLSSAAPRAAGAGSETWDGRNGSGAVVPDGTYTVAITASNAGGASSPATATVVVDDTAPAAPQVKSPSKATTTPKASTSISGTAAAGALVRVWVDANANGRRDAGEALAGSQQLAGSATSWSIGVALGDRPQPLRRDGDRRRGQHVGGDRRRGHHAALILPGADTLERVETPLSALRDAVQAASGAVAGANGAPRTAPTLERPKKAGFGDYATNAAMLLAPLAGAPPRDVAARLADELGTRLGPSLDRVEVAGPGFLNLFVSDAWCVRGARPRARRRRRVRRRRRRSRRARQRRVRLGEPDRAR